MSHCLSVLQKYASYQNIFLLDSSDLCFFPRDIFLWGGKVVNLWWCTYHRQWGRHFVHLLCEKVQFFLIKLCIDTCFMRFFNHQKYLLALKIKKIVFPISYYPWKLLHKLSKTYVQKDNLILCHQKETKYQWIKRSVRLIFIKTFSNWCSSAT